MKLERKKKSFVLKEKKRRTAKRKNLHTTKRKRKTTYDTRDFVASFFGKIKFSIFNAP